MDVAPEQGRENGSTGSDDLSISAAAQHGGTSREVAAEHEAPSQTNAAAKAARALGGGSRECHYSKLRRGRPEAEARACRQQRGEATAWLALFSGRDEDHGCTIAGKPSGAETDARCRPPFCGADLRGSSSSLGSVPGDAHKRTRHGTAETTTMPRRQLPSSGRSKCLAYAGMDEKHNTEGFHTQPFTSVPRTRRPGTKTRLFAAMKSLFYSFEEEYPSVA